LAALHHSETKNSGRLNSKWLNAHQAPGVQRENARNTKHFQPLIDADERRFFLRPRRQDAETQMKPRTTQITRTLHPLRLERGEGWGVEKFVAQGEVSAAVFEKYRIATYREASFKPFVIAAMIFLARVKDFRGVLKKLATE
jgi:hypothetical protein